MTDLDRRQFGALIAASPLGVSSSANKVGVRPTGDISVLVDPRIDAGQRLSHAIVDIVSMHDITGDRVRLMQAVLPARPAMIAGVSSHCDQVLIADIAEMSGYRLMFSAVSRDGATVVERHAPSMGSLAHAARKGGDMWPEIFAALVTGAPLLAHAKTIAPLKGRSASWVLVRRG